jgi:thiamine-monophosphate kinase
MGRWSGGRLSGVELGIGDDAAVIRADSATDLLFCSDLSVEGIHFRTEWAPPDVIGRKALAVTISDIAAMGGEPRFALASLALPRGFSMESIEQLLSGMFELARGMGFSVVGGDTSGSPGPLFIDTSAIGVCGRGRAISRAGARIGDLVYVTGELGGSALGLSLLRQGFRLDEAAGDSSDQVGRARQAAIKRHLIPVPRVLAGRMIGVGGLASAMIDISDGLATDLGHIAEASKCGAVIHCELLPVGQAVRQLHDAGGEIDPVELALKSGEEYELVFCSPPEAIERIREMSRELQLPITRIGEMIGEPGLFIERDDQTVIMDVKGFEHQI